ncbi:uncharacterized protein A4U43_C05F10350 [Asparagus officinalis]|uniref:non-specific serine/threonine protein kinase n=1 Tax=Asparagus officinalis TaxID=4686 RepID=A0A5P1EQP1_ASPOF|nr:uncharacterized protein A4U43_C05F10350 [Asparagus officinalis]
MRAEQSKLVLDEDGESLGGFSLSVPCRLLAVAMGDGDRRSFCSSPVPCRLLAVAMGDGDRRSFCSSLAVAARPLLSHALETGDFNELPDPRLENNYNEREMFRMIETAAACVRHSASMRPRMGLVVRALDLADIDLSNGMRPGQSELFSAQSAEIRLFQRMAFGSQDYSSDFSNFSNFSRTSRQTQRDS